VEIARAHLDGRLRASRSSPALMGLSRMGVASAETCGWTAPSAAAFELALVEKKFSIFAVSRLGTGRKKPLDPPKKPPEVSDHSEVHGADGETSTREQTDELSNARSIPNDVSGERVPSSSSAPDPRLAGKTFFDMVEYYYNVFLTRPDADDDDDDRSACDEDEFAYAPTLDRGGNKRRGAKKEQSGVPRNASERELARLGVVEKKPKKKKTIKHSVSPEQASAYVAELLRFTKRAAVDAGAAVAEVSAAVLAAKNSAEKGRRRASRGADPEPRAAAETENENDVQKLATELETPISNPPPLDLKSMAKMTRRWREAWPRSAFDSSAGADDSSLFGLRKELSALKGRTRKRAANDVAAGFSSDEDA
jgi:hypothetical protein